MAVSAITSTAARIFQSIEEGHVEEVKRMIQNGCGINMTNAGQMTPIMVAIMEDKTEIINFLLTQKGIDLDIRDVQGWTVLHWCAYKGLDKFIEDIIEAGGAVQATDCEGRTPLMLASSNGFSRTALKLLQKTPEEEIDIADRKGYTALSCAVEKNQTKLIEILLDSGADANFKEEEEVKSALELATETGYEAAIALFSKKQSSRYLKNLRQDDTTKHWSEEQRRKRMKQCGPRILFIGEYKAGKTSLARTIISGNQMTTSEDDRTVIVDHQHWINSKVAFTIVDVGGHKSYRFSGHYFHRNSPSNIATLCHDITSKRYEDSFFWIKAVLTRSPKCNIVVTLTKADLVQPQQIKDLKDQFIREISKYLKKEIDMLKVTSLMFKQSKPDTENKFEFMLEKYNHLYHHLRSSTFVTSCKDAEHHDIQKLKKRYEELQEDNAVEIPDHYQKLYVKLGKLGIRFEQTSRSNSADYAHRQSSDTESTTPPIPAISALEKKQVQHVDYSTALKIYREILIGCRMRHDTKIPNIDSSEEVDASLRKCLNLLHEYGLLMYFGEVPELKNIIFNDIADFIAILSSVFHHEVKAVLKFDSLSPEIRANIFANNATKFGTDVDKLLNQGLLSMPLLKVLINDYNLKEKVIVKLLEMLEVGFQGENIDDDIFVPYFVEDKHEPEVLSNEIKQVKSCAADALSLQCKITGNLPPAFWHYLLVRLHQHLVKQSTAQSRILWSNGFWATIGKKQVKMLLSFNNQESIMFYIKGSIASQEGHSLLWDYIRHIEEGTQHLMETWWPGLVTNIGLVCTHCRIPVSIPSGKSKHEWPLVDLLEGPDVETVACPNDPVSTIPSALILPLPKELEECKTRLDELDKYLRKKFSSNPHRQRAERAERHLDALLAKEMDRIRKTITEKMTSHRRTARLLDATVSDETQASSLSSSNDSTESTASIREYTAFQDKISKDKEISDLIQHTYNMRNIIIVSVSNKNMARVKRHLEENYPEVFQKLQFLNQSADESDIEFLVSNFKVSEAIGPGGFILKDDDLSVFHKHLLNKQKRGNIIPTFEDYLSSSQSNEISFGTIGCFVRDQDTREIFVMSVLHLVTVEQDIHFDGQAYMVSGFQHADTMCIHEEITDSNEDHELQTPFMARDYAHLSSKYFGILGLAPGNDKVVDIGLFGPLSKNVVEAHEEFDPNEKQKITVVEKSDERIMGKVVHKIGVSTGHTTGKIIASGYRLPSIRGTFLVTTLDENGCPEVEGKFAKKGDSGAIVFLKRGKFNALGLIHKTMREPFRHVYTDSRGRLVEKNLNNVVVCVRLNHCINSLTENIMWKPSYQLFYSHMKPSLCLGKQELPQELPRHPDMHAAENNDVNSDPHVIGFQPQEVAQAPNGEYLLHRNLSQKGNYVINLLNLNFILVPLLISYVSNHF